MISLDSSSSSSIFELPNKFGSSAAPAPVDLQGGGGDTTITPTVMNEIINGIQQTKNALLGNIPSRDIGMQTENVTQDEGVKVNFIPRPPKQQQQHPKQVRFYEDDEDYDDDDEDNQTFRKSSRSRGNRRPTRMQTMLALLHDPTILSALIAAILYFAFDIPLFRALFHKLFPYLFLDDGNMSLMGSVAKSSLFGLVVYILLFIII